MLICLSFGVYLLTQVVKKLRDNIMLRVDLEHSAGGNKQRLIQKVWGLLGAVGGGSKAQTASHALCGFADCI